MLAKLHLLVLAVLLAYLAMTAPASATNINTIATASVLTSGVTATGGMQKLAGDWVYYRINLSAGDEVTIDLGTSDAGDKICLYTYDPSITDYNLNTKRGVSIGDRSVCTSSNNGKTELAGVAPVSGEWTIALEGCDLGCGFNSQQQFSYDLTATVKLKDPPVTKPAPAKNPNCAGYVVLDSRGSGKPVNQLSSPAAAFVSAWEDKHKGTDVWTFTNPYPAVSIPEAVVAQAGLGMKYNASVSLGKKWLTTKLTALHAGCPQTKFFLTGYSQGAEVAGDAYQANPASYIAGVVLFGDPHFNSADSWVDRGSFAQSNRRRNGIHSPRPVFPNGADGKVLSFCHQGDPVCQGDKLAMALRRDGHHMDYGAKEAAEATLYFGDRK